MGGRSADGEKRGVLTKKKMSWGKEGRRGGKNKRPKKRPSNKAEIETMYVRKRHRAGTTQQELSGGIRRTYSNPPRNACGSQRGEPLRKVKEGMMGIRESTGVSVHT